MNRNLTFRLLAALAAFALSLFSPIAHAQSDSEAIPPALQAALQSGTAEQIVQAINTLAAGNPARAAQLAAQAAVYAQALVASNPERAVSIAATVTNFAATLVATAPVAAAEAATEAAKVVVTPSLPPTVTAAVQEVLNQSAQIVATVVGNTGNAALAESYVNATSGVGPGAPSSGGGGGGGGGSTGGGSTGGGSTGGGSTGGGSTGGPLDMSTRSG